MTCYFGVDLEGGYALDDLTWCSNPDKPAQFGRNCTSCTPYYHSAQGSYWDQISRRLASLAIGERAHVILNGRKDTVFNSGGVFGRVEIRELQKLNIKLKIMIFNAKSNTVCSNDESIKALKAIMKNKIDGCIDNQSEVEAMMKCQPGSSCNLYQPNSGDILKSTLLWLILFYVLKLNFN
ncbi:DgyrCDS5435 [Dimorphilus gyrociliatus]|uniref:DgyrCDS5435 n=1 Tax=Dimorphilus gyrociliatus TaxID=2664684 RepID=A0A7I8VK14_9ANNE|nr:DgyrCDS5435 [Dimorphilus gyrociliatus]